MRCLVVTQTHPETGEKYVAFSTNPMQEIGELTLSSGGWEKGRVQHEIIVIVASEEICDALGNSELRSQVDPHGLLIGSDCVEVLDDPVALGRLIHTHLEQEMNTQS